MSIRIGIGNYIRPYDSGVPAGYVIQNAELTTYITGLATPLSDDQLERLDTFITALKTGLSITNLSDAFDVMYVLAGETEESSLKNLVKNAHHCTNVNATVWAQYEGFTGDGASSYLDTNYNPNSQGVKFTQNDACFGIYIRTNKLEDTFDCGHTQAGSNPMNYLYTRYTSLGASMKVNSTNNSAHASTDSSGFWIANRVVSANQQLYRNLATIGDDAKASTGVPNSNFFILARNNSGTPGGLTTRQISFFFTGSALSSDNRTALQSAIEAYMDANGKGVIT